MLAERGENYGEDLVGLIEERIEQEMKRKMGEFIGEMLGIRGNDLEI